MKAEIYPLDRVELDGKSVSLGMKRAEVESSIGAGQVVRGNEYYYCRNEMKAGGIPVEGNEDLEADKRRAEHWATIGFGVAGYYE